MKKFLRNKETGDMEEIALDVNFGGLNPLLEIVFQKENDYDVQPNTKGNLADLLWNAADQYQRFQLDAVEMNSYTLNVMRGVLQSNNAKMVANLNWVESLWTEYYERKTDLIEGRAISLDFSECGFKPFSYLEVFNP